MNPQTHSPLSMTLQTADHNLTPQNMQYGLRSRLTLNPSQITNIGLFQTQSLQTTISNSIKMAKTSPNR